MPAPRWELFAASCGVLFAAFFVAGFALQDTGASSSDVSAAEVLSSYSDSDTEHRREIGATFVGFAVFFLLVFLGTLRRALAAAEGNSRLFSSSAFAGGIAMAVFLGASAALQTAVASAKGFYDAYEVDANTVLAFSTLSFWSFGLALVGAAVLIGSASLLAWKTGLPEVARNRRVRRHGAWLLRRVNRRLRRPVRSRRRMASHRERDPR